MSGRNDGGPAFPVADPDQTFSAKNVDEFRRLLSGMSLRDYFAAQSIPCLLSGATWSDVRDGADECAKAAYALADAMLKAREAS